ncbi:hypothetical protein HDU82_007154 [Entophlyctis luteolus]|nr:hypothetical protein HDU82_007154 [Entophlyctis luteolus]
MTTTTTTPRAPKRQRQLPRAPHEPPRKRLAAPVRPLPLLRPHPLCVQPMGNALLHAPDMSHLYADRRRGLGLLAALDDALLVAFLADPRLLPDHRSVLRLAQCSRAAYIFCSFDDIWRSRCIARFNGTFGPVFGLSWKNTFKSACVRLGHSLPLPERSEVTETTPACVGPFFSDYLFCSWRCAATPLDLLCRTSAPENIDRRSKLSVSDFIAEYDAPGIPVILTDVVPQWPAFTKWSMQYLADSFPDVVFRAESIDVPFSTYASYSARCCLDGGSFEEAPIYLFDKFFASRTDLTQDYSVPEYFSQDYFKLLGAENRPDYRWIIIGPPRSGSTFHIDPNSTSAWNAVIKGSKKWILFPPDCIPPGVFPSADGSEVTTPISLAEWFLNHYDEMKSWPVQPIECICREGELLYVPRGWWHCVMNIEETIAITQNFVNDCNLENVLQFIRTKGDQVSGYGSSESGCIMANTLLTRFTHALASSRIPKYLSILDYEQMKASVPTREIPSKQETPLSGNIDLYFAYMFFKYTNNLKQSALEESNKSADIRNAPAQLAGKTLDVIAIHGLISSSFIILVLVSSSVMVATFFFLNQLEEIDVIQRLLKCTIYIGMLGSSVMLVHPALANHLIGLAEICQTSAGILEALVECTKLPDFVKLHVTSQPESDIVARLDKHFKPRMLERGGIENKDDVRLFFIGLVREVGLNGGLLANGEEDVTPGLNHLYADTLK